jgi:YD repeat-containing protein
VACVQGKAKIEGITERVSGMKKSNEDIDLLLERNAAGQLDRFDWDGLGTTISRRLNQAQQSKTSGIRFPTIFKIAAGFIAAAAVVFIAVMIRTDTPTTVRFENRGRAEVKFSESKGSATVEILDSNGQNNKRGDRSAWIIIRVPEPMLADNGISKDENDFACLL